MICAQEKLISAISDAIHCLSLLRELDTITSNVMQTAESSLILSDRGDRYVATIPITKSLMNELVEDRIQYIRREVKQLTFNIGEAV